MKTFYSILLFTLLTFIGHSQAYNYGIVNTDNYNFKIVAIPDFDASTDASDMGFTLTLPAGTTDIINVNSLLASRTWTMQQFDAAFLTSQGLGDGSRDVFLFNNPPGQSLIAHTAGEQIDLVSFSVSNMPTTGEMAFLDNTDPIATGASGVLDSFYNSNIDNTTTQDYFGGYASGLNAIMFDTLGINEEELTQLALKVYPNPTKDSIAIQSRKPIQIAKLFDVTGKQVMLINNPSKISLRNLPSGVYLLKLKTEFTTMVKRIVKQ